MSNNKNLLPQYEIEGFDPNESPTVVQEIDEKGQVKETLFMRFQEGLAWFLTVYPEGCLTHVFNKLDERKASVYRSANDARAADTATCTRYYDESINGPYYEQNTVTAAYRKALGYLGFGTPLDAHVCEGQKVASAVEVVEKSEARVEIPVPRPSVRNIESMLDTTQEPTAVPTPTPAPEKPAEKKAEPVKLPTTLEEAKRVLLPAGEFKGLTIQVAAQATGDPYIRWWADKCKAGRYAGSPFAKAVEI